MLINAHHPLKKMQDLLLRIPNHSPCSAIYVIFYICHNYLLSIQNEKFMKFHSANILQKESCFFSPRTLSYSGKIVSLLKLENFALDFNFLIFWGQNVNPLF